jgi:uncharacterized protein (TIGR03435 family)
MDKPIRSPGTCAISLLTASVLLAVCGLQSHASAPAPTQPATQAPASQSPAAQLPATTAELPAFEVSTVKPSDPNHPGSRLWFTPDGIKITGVSLQMTVREALGTEDDHVLGEPSWTKTAMFDIEAKVAPEVAPRLKDMNMDQRRQMLVPLLEDRFQLKFHHETRELTVYELVVAKSGVKMQAAKPADGTTPGPPPGPGQPPRPGSHMLMTRGPGHIESTGTGMEFLAHVLSGQLGRTVVDKTGLTGNWDYKLDWTPDDASLLVSKGGGDGAAGDGVSTPENSGPSLFTAVQEQLGLKLESVKTPADVIVIDQIEQPTPN